MQSPPFPRYLVPPRPKYSPQHLVLKHPQFPFLPQCQRPSFTPIQNKSQNYNSWSLNFWIATWKTKQLGNLQMARRLYTRKCIVYALMEK